MQSKFLSLASALLFLGVTSLSWAQPSTAPDPTTPEGKRAEGRARYERGADAYAKGRFTDAIDLFLEADALAPSAALSFNIAPRCVGTATFGDAPPRPKTAPRSTSASVRSRRLWPPRAFNS
jgi:hypothetical protein